MKPIVLGIDVGNYDTKSENTSIISGYKEYDVCPTMVNEFMEYKGKFYAPNVNRFDYIPDKTKDEHMFILTLMSIAKEILFRKDRDHAKGQELASRSHIPDQVIEICLAVGVPPAHHAKLAKPYADYYKTRFGEQTDFSYDGIEFHIHVNTVRVFTQDYSVVMAFGKKSKYISQGFSRYSAVDIGGKTVDTVVVNDLVAEKYKSIETGIITMYEEIESMVNNDFGVKLDHTACEHILLDKPTVIRDEIKARVKNMAKEWADSIISNLRGDLDFETYPTIFIGGGAKILKPYLTKNSILANYEFLGSANANAQAYARLLRGLLQQ